jgi:hypothetical protein
MLIGRKGKDIEPGYIYVPYVTTQSITTIQKYKNYFRKSKIRRLLGMPSADSMMSRYATKKVNNNFYTTQDIKKPLN